jgi:dipeptidyl aminopeptidase/acylaminoacyl peptidase
MRFRVRRSRLELFAAACSLLLTSTLTAQTPAKPTLTAAPDTANPNQEFSRSAQPGGVAISPDGTTVAWTLRNHDSSVLHLTEVANPANDKLVKIDGATNCSVDNPTWAPNGQTLAFRSTCTGDKSKPDQDQIFLWSKASGEVKQLTHLIGNIAQPAWSPDGKSIAFLFVENATRHAGALDAMPPWNGVIGEDGVEVQTIYMIGGVDNGGNTGISLTTSPLHPAIHVYEFSWAPDSKHLAFVGAAPPGENNWWIAKLYTVKTPPWNGDTTGPEKPTVILDPTTIAGALHGLQIAVPRYSPDGKHIAFIGGLMSDQGSTGGDVWVIDAKGGEPTDITPNIDGTPAFEAWISDHTISFVEDRSGHTLISAYNINTKALVPGAPVDLGEVSISGGSIKDAVSVSDRIGDSKDRAVAFAKSSFNESPEIYVAVNDKLTQLTHLNDAVKNTAPKFESIEWQNEGFHVQGWLTYPKNYDPAKKYPLIVEVHGGPSASAGPRPSTMWSEQGYFVLAPNPRGSYGQGEKFVQANRKDFGYGDLRDILKGMDAVEAKVSIDKNREGLTGWSYGGFMTMFAVTQTHRFRAAVAGAGLSDWLSYYGENSIDQWMTPFFGASVYDDPAVYAKSSAINFIKNVTTPTLVIVGDRDGECPAPQSFEFWHALRDLGVKTQLVVYPNEGHGFRNPEHIRDRMEREVRWFAENMPPTK